MWKRDYCKYCLEDGYCHNWFWRREVKKWKMRKDTVNGRTSIGSA